ncbi:hypothetical protein DFH09DRAFT_1324872 [Mycena vulgaris]|nr:hypothetical protein DFH09DRAFT_1324872 [Mycena vulgaris]
MELNAAPTTDRELLVESPVVIEELLCLPEAYRSAIVSNTVPMGPSMAGFAARLVTEGLSLIFAASSKGSPPALTAQLELSNSMGLLRLLLLKTTITRNVAEDVGEAERWYFWPREVWTGGRYGGGFGGG